MELGPCLHEDIIEATVVPVVAADAEKAYDVGPPGKRPVRRVSSVCGGAGLGSGSWGRLGFLVISCLFLLSFTALSTPPRTAAAAASSVLGLDLF